MILTVLVGCSGDDGTSGAFGEMPDDEVWYPEPAALRIHPSTRYVQDGSRVYLDTRVEVLDNSGDPLKYPGRFRFELWRSGLGGATRTLAYVWRFSVLNYPDQQAAYDPVTRCYGFELTLDDIESADQLSRMTLQVHLETPDGSRLQREMTVRP